jgi:hypothetical protein
MMIRIESDTFNIDAIMGLHQGVETNLVLSDLWNKIPYGQKIITVEKGGQLSILA